MGWQILSRNKVAWINAVLLMVLAIIMPYASAYMNHFTYDSPPLTCDHHLDWHYEIAFSHEKVASVILPYTARYSTIPLHEEVLTKLLYAAIFHPPK